MRGLVVALQFMTRIPIPISLDIDEKTFGSSSRFFPLVGLIIGFFLALVYKIGVFFFPPLVMGALIIIAEIILTGGLHLDGFMDTVDGLMSSRPKDEAIKIMKDSRVGAHSVTALFILLLLKFSVIVSLPGIFAPFYLLIMPVVGRWMLLYCLAFFPYAKGEGLGKAFCQNTNKGHWLFATLFTLILFLLLLPFSQMISLLITFLVMLTPILGIVNFMGGHTGDTYGAVNEITEVVFILICLLLANFK
ncbi:MAG: adenosylcobinamide-GDP ribazoletransferase [Peptococcales bacterium]|jgi:adenosylcobinamide-GDP ribazoletransferase